MDVTLPSGPVCVGIQFDASRVGVHAREGSQLNLRLNLRGWIGRSTIEEMEGPAVRPLKNQGAQVVFVLTVASGTARIGAGGKETQLSAGDVAVLAQGEDVSVALAAGSTLQLIRTPRRIIQSIASESCNKPCRLSNVNLVVPASKSSERLNAATEHMISLLSDCAIAHSDERQSAELKKAAELEWAKALVASLWRLAEHREIFALAGSVARGIEFIRRRAPLACAMSEIASFAGVSPITLRKNFRSCLDTSVAAFEQRARLEWSYASLASANENRSIAELAAAAGYKSSQAFTLAFQRLFGENPSIVRSRAVREVRAA